MPTAFFFAFSYNFHNSRDIIKIGCDNMLYNSAKRYRKTCLISAISTLILGVVLMMEPAASLKIITVIIGLMCLIIGAFWIFDYIKASREEKMISKSLLLGIISAGIGLYLVINTESLVNFITLIIGITLCIKSIVKLQFSINIRGFSKTWKYNLLFSLLGLTLGILLLINPFSGAQMFFRIVGIVMIIGSIIELVECAFIMKNLNIREAKKELRWVDKDE